MLLPVRAFFILEIITRFVPDLMLKIMGLRLRISNEILPKFKSHIRFWIVSGKVPFSGIQSSYTGKAKYKLGNHYIERCAVLDMSKKYIFIK